MQAAFEGFVLDGKARSEESLGRPGAFPYTVLFAPAWLYRSHPENGGTSRVSVSSSTVWESSTGCRERRERFRGGQRRDHHGGGTRGNGRRARPDPGQHQQVRAGSGSGPLSLDDAGRDRGRRRVAQCGRCAGRHPARRRRPPSARLVAHSRLLLALGPRHGWPRIDVDGAEPWRLNTARLPDSIAVVNLVAVPLSGSVGPKLRWSTRSSASTAPTTARFCWLTRSGPGESTLSPLAPTTSSLRCRKTPTVSP